MQTYRPISSTYFDLDRGAHIYGEAFRRAFEYIYGCRLHGAVAEFGTYEGFTALIQAGLIKEFTAHQDYIGHPMPHLYLYDSFIGLPDPKSSIDRESYEVKHSKQWLEGEIAPPPGTPERLRAALCELLPQSQVTIVAGFYAETLARTPVPEKLALLNLDCDFYESSKQVLESILKHDNFQDGTVLMCDDYNCNRAQPDQGQRRALREVFADAPYAISEFFSYGWHGRAFFVHKR